MTMQTNKERITRLQRINLILAIPDNLLFGGVFKFHQRLSSIIYLLNSRWRFILFFPIAIFSLVRATFSWMTLGLDRTLDNRYKKLNWIQALWDTFQAIGITGAVVIGTIDYFMPISPLVGIGIAYTFAVLLAASSCYQLALAGYFYSKSANKEEGFAAAKTNLILSGLLASYCISLTLCMIMGFLVLGSTMGMMTSLLAASFTAYNLYKMEKSTSKDTNIDGFSLLKDTFTDSSKKILKTIGIDFTPIKVAAPEKNKQIVLEKKTELTFSPKPTAIITNTSHIKSLGA